MRIGELARRTGVGAHLLRYYEAQQLIAPSRRDNGYREYGEDAVDTVLRIRALLDAGLSTEDIATVLPCASGASPDLVPCPELLATLRARLRGIDERIGTLTRSRAALVGYLAAADGRSVPVAPVEIEKFS